VDEPGLRIVPYRPEHEAALLFYEAIGYSRDPVIPMGKRLVEDG
jgi:hypothetical protein